MKPIPPNDVILYAGKRRVGKSTRMCYDIRNGFSKYIIFDYKREGDFDGMGVIVRGGLEQVKQAIDAGYTKLVFQTKSLKEEIWEQVNEILYWMLANCRNWLVAFDELSFYMSTHKICEGIEAIINVGGGKGFGLMGNIQMPKDCNNTMKQQCGAVIAHSLAGTSAEAVEDLTRGQIKASELERLGKYEALMWSDHEDPQDPCVFRLPPVPL